MRFLHYVYIVYSAAVDCGDSNVIVYSSTLLMFLRLFLSRDWTYQISVMVACNLSVRISGFFPVITPPFLFWFQRGMFWQTSLTSNLSRCRKEENTHDRERLAWRLT